MNKKLLLWFPILLIVIVTILVYYLQVIRLDKPQSVAVTIVDGKITSKRFAMKHVDLVPASFHSSVHANMVASFITGLDKQDRVTNIGVANDNGTVSVDKMVSALDYIEKRKIDVVNLSIAFPVENRQIKNHIMKIVKNGTIIIAAAGDTGSGSVEFPANIDGVISVGSINHNGVISVFSPDKNVSAYAEGEGIKYQEKPIYGTSFSTPIITSKVISDLNSGMSVADISKKYSGGYKVYE